ncbi:MAG: glycosyltransferase family 39 protein [Caldilineaceae bacterium]|nr:glycosyltransferase family 39 protein [Caldilineaceae bacterium]
MSTKQGNQSWPMARSHLALGCITLLGLAIRSYALARQSIWLDEAFSIWLAQQHLVDLWAWLIKIDQHPPLYYTLLHYWLQFFGDGPNAVRALSVLCSSAAIPFFYGASRYWVGQRTALLAALLLALSPFHVRYAQEARMYALLTLSTAVALYALAFLLYAPRARQQRWPWWALALAQSSIMLTHNTATVFFPVALNSAVGCLWLWQRWRKGLTSLPNLAWEPFARSWLATQGLALILWLPWSIAFVIQATLVDREFWIELPTVATIYHALHNFNLATLPAWSRVGLAINYGWWLLAALGLYALRHTPARALLLLLLWLLPIGGELLVSLRRPIFADRTLIGTTLPYLLLVATGLGEAKRLGKLGTRWCQPWQALRPWLNVDRLSKPVKSLITPNLAVAVGLLLLLGLHGWALQRYFVHYEKEGWAAAAAYVATEVETGDLLLFHASWVELPFQYYFRHYEKDVVSRGLPVDLFDRGVLEPKMSTADLPYLNSLLVDRDELWLIYAHQWYTDPQGILLSALQQQMILVEQQSFTGLEVMHFRREDEKR